MVFAELRQRIDAADLDAVDRTAFHLHQVGQMQAVGAQIAQPGGVGLAQHQGRVEHDAGHVVGVAVGVAQPVVLQELQHVVLIDAFHADACLGIIDGLERQVHVARGGKHRTPCQELDHRLAGRNLEPAVEIRLQLLSLYAADSLADRQELFLLGLHGRHDPQDVLLDDERKLPGTRHRHQALEILLGVERGGESDFKSVRIRLHVAFHDDELPLGRDFIAAAAFRRILRPGIHQFQRALPVAGRDVADRDSMRLAVLRVHPRHGSVGALHGEPALQVFSVKAFG